MSMLTVRDEGRMLTIADYEARIEIYKEQIGTGYIGIGRTLNEAKEAGAVPHGEWESWVERVTGLTIRQAQRCMQAAREIRDGSAMARLEMSKALMLLSSGLDEETREELAEQAGSGTVKKLRAEIARIRGEQEAEKAEAAEAVKALKLQITREAGTAAEIREALKKAETERSQLAAQMRAAQGAWQERLDEEVGRAYQRGVQDKAKGMEAEIRKEFQGKIDYANNMRKQAEEGVEILKAQLAGAEKRRQEMWDEAFESGKFQAGKEWKEELDELAAEKLKSDDRANALELDMQKAEKALGDKDEEIEDLKAELEAAESREAKRAAQMKEMREQMSRQEMDAARGVRAQGIGGTDLGDAVRRFLAAAGVLPQMGAVIARMDEEERELLRAHVETMAAWVTDARAALGTVSADGSVQ